MATSPALAAKFRMYPEIIVGRHSSLVRISFEIPYHAYVPSLPGGPSSSRWPHWGLHSPWVFSSLHRAQATPWLSACSKERGAVRWIRAHQHRVRGQCDREARQLSFAPHCTDVFLSSRVGVFLLRCSFKCTSLRHMTAWLDFAVLTGGTHSIPLHQRRFLPGRSPTFVMAETETPKKPLLHSYLQGQFHGFPILPSVRQQNLFYLSTHSVKGWRPRLGGF